MRTRSTKRFSPAACGWWSGRGPAPAPAAIQVWIKAGGFLEDQTTSGYAHVIEHLVFKGTQRRGPGAIDEEIESLGGNLPAPTEKDWTMYGTTVASQHALHVIDVLGDALRHPRFQTSDF